MKTRLTDSAQNALIAEACGWTKVCVWRQHGLPDEVRGYPPKCETIYQYTVPVPDYVNDLNEMHKAERLLLPDDAMYSQQNFYAANLGSITLNDNNRGWEPLSNDDCFPILHASARQRAEAFLRTIEKWED